MAVGTVNFNGTGQFAFALVNSNGTTTFWSNDGTSNAGSQPVSAVALTVTNGLYSVLLGDTTLTNMAAIPTNVWANADVRLRIWFNDGTHGFQLLTPDQRLTPNGYLPDGSISSSKISAGAVSTIQLAPNAVQTGNIAAGAVTNAQLAGNAIQSGNIAAGAVGSSQLASDLTLPGTTTGTFSGVLSPAIKMLPKVIVADGDSLSCAGTQYWPANFSGTQTGLTIGAAGYNSYNAVASYTGGSPVGNASGVKPGSAWPEQMIAMPGAPTVLYDFAFAGRFSSDVLLNYFQEGHLLAPNITGVPAAYVIWVGTNDVGNGWPASEIYGNIAQLCRWARADGYAPIVALNLYGYVSPTDARDPVPSSPPSIRI